MDTEDSRQRAREVNARTRKDCSLLSWEATSASSSVSADDDHGDTEVVGPVFPVAVGGVDRARQAPSECQADSIRHAQVRPVPVEGRREPGVEPPEGCDGEVQLVESAAVNCALPGIPTRGGKLPATP